MKVETRMDVGEALARLLPDSSGRTRKRALEDGRVRVNAKVVRRQDHRLAPGDRVELVGRDEGVARPTRIPEGLRVVHEDAEVLVVEKAPGLPTIATAKERERTAYALLTAHVRRRDPHARVLIVHRLDQLASGLLVFARTWEAKRKLQDQFSDRSVEREYAVVVEGRLEGEGEVRSRLREDPSLRVREVATGGVEARTRYRVRATGDRTSSLEVQLDTGRRHQIRVQLAGLGHPVVGDPLYGTGGGEARRLALHARTLAFDHPRTGERMRFESAVPQAIRRLGWK